MTYLLLFAEFFKIGLLAVGGGLVTLPFLFDLAEKYPWFDVKTLTDMVAISESTPGPLGVNMATYAGFSAAGIGGGIVATLGLVLPSLLIIVLLAKVLQKYRNHPILFSNIVEYFLYIINFIKKRQQTIPHLFILRII